MVQMGVTNLGFGLAEGLAIHGLVSENRVFIDTLNKYPIKGGFFEIFLFFIVRDRFCISHIG